MMTMISISKPNKIFKSKIKKDLIIYICLLFFSFHLSCDKEIVPEPYQPSNAHEAYRLSLEQVNLSETALGKDWIAASKKVLANPIEISSPFQEAFYIDSTSAFAIAYQFPVKRGQRVEVDISFKNRQHIQLFMDLFRVTGDSITDWIKVASANENEKRLEFEPRHDAKYVIRLQPELLRGGRCNVVIRNVASVAFPIPSKNRKSILSFFGAPRDGGRREHHGVDIFAPRHTPIIASAKSTVRYVGEGGIGGHVIWLLDIKRNYYYYLAHLETDSVYKNQIVEAGQVVGTVGNSGNARTTSPHLHFGIYIPRGGPVDPINFIKQIKSDPAKITADPNLIGRLVKSKPAKVTMRSASGSILKQTKSLERNTPMKVLAATKNLLRIALPDGNFGYIRSNQIEPISKSIQQLTATVTQTIIDKPTRNAISKSKIEVGDEYSILGKYEDYWLVKEQQGNIGWIEISTAVSSQNVSSDLQN